MIANAADFVSASFDFLTKATTLLATSSIGVVAGRQNGSPCNRRSSGGGACAPASFNCHAKNKRSARIPARAPSMYMTHAGGTDSVAVHSSSRAAPEIGSRKSAIAEVHASDNATRVGANLTLGPNTSRFERALAVPTRFPVKARGPVRPALADPRCENRSLHE